MGRYRRVNLLVGLIIFPALLFAQSFNNNTSSPYSRFGMGDLQPYSFGRSAAMGGASIASRYSQQINLANPASYTAIDSLVFNFEIGINSRFSQFKNKLGTANTNNVNFEYLAMKFQINNRIGAAFGLMPYSDMGYIVNQIQKVDNGSSALVRYYGAGTVSKAFMGIAVEPLKNLSIGVDLNYIFGKLNHNAEVFFLESSDFYSTQQYGDFRLRDFNLDFGIQYTLPISDDKHIVLAGIFDFAPSQIALKSDITKKIFSSVNSANSDTLHISEEEKGIIKMPLTYGGGISFVKDNVFEINFDYYHQSWSDATFFGSKGVNITDLNSFAVGAEWIPNKFSIRNYMSRVAYRAGMRYKETYVMIGDNQINDFGISFGIGLPVYRSNTTINIAAEFGKKGTMKNRLILENYARFNVSLNLYDLWFIKRKFD